LLDNSTRLSSDELTLIFETPVTSVFRYTPQESRVRVRSEDLTLIFETPGTLVFRYMPQERRVRVGDKHCSSILVNHKR